MSFLRYDGRGYGYSDGNLKTWVKSVLWIGGIMLGLMWYTAAGNFVYNKYFLDYHVARCEAGIQTSCDPAIDDLTAASVFWPVSVPISFAVRHPILFGLLMPVGAAGGLGLYGSYRGVAYLRDEKRRLRIEKQEETERKLREATEALEKLAPEYAQLVKSS